MALTLYLLRTRYVRYDFLREIKRYLEFILNSQSLASFPIYLKFTIAFTYILQVELLFNTINNILGNGVNMLSLTGEGREADESSFTPIKDLNIPYHLFSMVDICDTAKEITIEERVIVYYKYDNYPVNCVKIFRSAYRAKPFGFR